MKCLLFILPVSVCYYVLHHHVVMETDALFCINGGLDLHIFVLFAMQ